MDELKNYVFDTDSPIKNFNMARWYEDRKHHSPAASFFLRAAELSGNDLDLRYESLLRTYFCYNRLGNRDFTCESILKSAVVLAPKRPEAYYFLSEHYERKNDWLNSYVFSSIGLDVFEKTSNFISYMYFEGIYQLYFRKAKACWWMGKSDEARKIYGFVLDNFIEELRPEYKTLLEQNLSSLGGGPEYLSFKQYTKSLKDKFKFPFEGLDSIEKNFSQVYQDMFVLAVLEGKIGGSYLEIGSSKPFYGNNTALLELDFDWKGIGIDNNLQDCNEYSAVRKNPVIHDDALTVNYEKIIQNHFPEQYVFDYLQIDIEPAKQTFEALMAVPFEKYKFKVITYEHDHYVDITKSYRSKSRRYLESMGYELAVNDICAFDNCSFEDWWVNPDLINPDILAKIRKIDYEKCNLVENYILN
jgi:hypothetical protein